MIRQMKYFQAVVHNNSFSKAAEECHISQSAISQQIQALERELGFHLLKRKNRKFILTSAGEYFYKKSLILIADYEQMCREAARLSKDGKATLVIGYLRSYSGQELHLALEEAHLMIIAGQGFMSVEGVKQAEAFSPLVSRIPLFRGGSHITRNYCTFWKKDNSGYYVEEFADILKKKFI